jgi:CheY-like chemotaxis protein
MKPILIIDNQRSTRSLIGRWLRKHGHITIEADMGKKGVILAQEYLPALILCSVDMPGLTGFGVLNMLRQDINLRRVPCILISPEDLAIADKHATYLKKPLDQSQLIETVTLFLSKQTACSR